MLRIIPILFLLFFTALSGLTLAGQNMARSQYHDYWGRRLIFRSDSTFRFEQGADTRRSWCEGTWTQRGDTIFAHPVAILDTMLVHCHRGFVDSVFLSTDSRAERFHGNFPVFKLCEQDTEYIPNCFVSKDDKLYWIAPTGYRIDSKDYAWRRFDRSLPPKEEDVIVPFPFSGKYTNHGGGVYEFKSDSAFEYYWHGHLTYRWATGRWSIVKDTLCLFADVPVDTVAKTDVRDLPYDSVFLSKNATSERLADSAKENIDHPGYHSPEMITSKLWIHKNRLYLILPDGAIDYEKREDGFYGRRSMNYTYYERQ